MPDQDSFVMFTEQHYGGDNTDTLYFPGRLAMMKGLYGLSMQWMGLSPEEAAQRAYGQISPEEWKPSHLPPVNWKTVADNIVKGLDAAGIDVITILRGSYLKDSGYAAARSTNGQSMEICSYHPDRLLLEINVGPVIRRGVEHANWELEYLYKNHGAVACKVYQVEDDGPLNDRRMYPFYAKAEELGIPLTIHLGTAYPGVHLTKHALPLDLDEVCIDFPDLKIIGYHMAWPYQHDLIALAGKHKNVHLSLTGILAWYERAPAYAWHHIGEALAWCGPDKIVLGSDGPPEDLKRRCDFARNVQIPVDLQQTYAYPKITEETRAKMLGLNLARVTGVEPRKRIKTG